MKTVDDETIAEDKSEQELADVKCDKNLQNKDLKEEGNGSSELKDNGVKSLQEVSPKVEVAEHKGTTMSKLIEPPTFLNDEKSYAEYKKDLKRWSRICGVEKKLQAEVVVYRLEGHPSRIKEKINTQIGDKLEDNEEGIKELINFLDTIYTKDHMADAWEKFCEFSNFHKKPDQTMFEFIAEWENCYFKMKNAECEYSDLILAFKLLSDSKLNEIDTKLVLTGVDYEDGKAKKNLLGQVKESLKKFKGRPVIMEERGAVQVSDTFVSTDMEQVFLSKGWKPPKKERRRSRSLSPQRPRSQQNKNLNYKGRKNQLGADNKPMKCFKCKCSCATNCNCPCVYHFANKCTKTTSNYDKQTVTTDQNKSLVGLYVQSNILSNTEEEPVFMAEVESDNRESDEDLVLISQESLEDLALISIESTHALIDCACNW